MEQIIHSSVEKFCQLHMCASQAVTVGSQANSRIPASCAGTTAPGEPQKQAAQGESTTVATISKEAAQFIGNTLRPDVHIGIQYPQFPREYGILKTVNTLKGENYHRQVSYSSPPRSSVRGMPAVPACWLRVVSRAGTHLPPERGCAHDHWHRPAFLCTWRISSSSCPSFPQSKSIFPSNLSRALV